MGYTTEFEGAFHCYRSEHPRVGQFLDGLQAGDETVLPLLTDWLTERGDPRGPQLTALLPGRGSDLSGVWRLFALTPEHAAYLRQFEYTPRMRRDPDKALLLLDPLRVAVGLPIGKEGGYFVGGTSGEGSDHDASVQDSNSSPVGQPSLWCGWRPNEDGTAIVWDRGEKFYYYIEWLEYLIEHFLKPWGYRLNGTMNWVGQDAKDRGVITVRDNAVSVTSTRKRTNRERRRALLLQHLAIHFGPLGDNVRQRVEACPAYRLDELAKKLLTVDSLADLGPAEE